MKKDTDKGQDKAPVENKNEELLSRRSFFKSAAKAAIPILGFIVLSKFSIPSEAKPVTGCEKACVGDCGYACQSCWTGCTGSCKSECSGNGCKTGCYGNCNDRCAKQCSGLCNNRCYDSCQGGCKKGCGYAANNPGW